MFQYTSTEAAPWKIIRGNHKWFARIDVLKTVVNQLAEGIDTSPPAINPEVIQHAYEALGITIKTE